MGKLMARGRAKPPKAPPQSRGRGPPPGAPMLGQSLPSARQEQLSSALAVLAELAEEEDNFEKGVWTFLSPLKPPLPYDSATSQPLASLPLPTPPPLVVCSAPSPTAAFGWESLELPGVLDLQRPLLDLTVPGLLDLQRSVLDLPQPVEFSLGGVGMGGGGSIPALQPFADVSSVEEPLLMSFQQLQQERNVGAAAPNWWEAGPQYPAGKQEWVPQPAALWEQEQAQAQQVQQQAQRPARQGRPSKVYDGQFIVPKGESKASLKRPRSAAELLDTATSILQDAQPSSTPNAPLPDSNVKAPSAILDFNRLLKMPQMEAAALAGMTVSALREASRRAGIRRWPSRRNGPSSSKEN